MKSTTAEHTIHELRKIFSAYGAPKELVSDNGPQFIAENFQHFLKMNGVKHTLTAPYHPASNGAAERAVQTLKNALKKHTLESERGNTTEQKLCSFLLLYRTTPHTVSGVSPAQLFLKRSVRTCLTLIKPSLQDHVQDKQLKMKDYHDQRVPKLREFVKNECVRVKNCRGTDIKYVPGTIVHRVGPTQYLVRVGRSIRYVHGHHILKSGEAPEDMLSPEAVVRDTPAVPPHVPPGIPHVPQSAGLPSEVPASPRPTRDVRVPGPSVQSPISTPMRGVQQRAPTKGIKTGTPTKGVPPEQATPQRRYPVRSRAVPSKLQDFVVGSK